MPCCDWLEHSREAKERLRPPGHAGAPARGTGRMWQAAAAGTRETEEDGIDM
jgi:hypothetical protein